MNRKDNSKECAFEGYKLSYIIPDVEVSHNVVRINIGCEEDDSFYKGDNKSGRVKVEIETIDNTIINLDLEDILVFSKIYCSGIYKRINETETPFMEK